MKNNKVGNIRITKANAKDFKTITECEEIIIEERVKAELPLLAQSGYIDVSEGASLTCKLTKNLNYKSIDNTFFVIEAEKTSKGIKILSGYVLRSIEKGKLVKDVCFVAEKDNYYAHGATVKKAIGDLQFKIVAEKLKKEPINKDTKFTVKYYRLVTGACDSGVRNWMQQHKIRRLYTTSHQ